MNNTELSQLEALEMTLYNRSLLVTGHELPLKEIFTSPAFLSDLFPLVKDNSQKNRAMNYL